MEGKIIKQLNWLYYGWYVAAIVVFSVSKYLIMNDLLPILSPLSPWGSVLQYFVIGDMLLTLPLGLYLHKRRCTRIALIEDKTMQMAAYKKSAALRIVLVGNTVIFSILAFFMLGCYQSMLWVSGIILIGLFFTKPTEDKMCHDLQNDDQDENYST